MEERYPWARGSHAMMKYYSPDGPRLGCTHPGTNGSRVEIRGSGRSSSAAMTFAIPGGLG
jgi:hypothetical protein